MLELLVQRNKLYFLKFKQSLPVFIYLRRLLLVSTQVNHVVSVRLA